MKIAAIDIGGTSIKSGLIKSGVLSDFRETPTNATLGGELVLEKVRQIITSYEDFDRVALCTAGQINSHNGIVKAANENLPGYAGLNIRDKIKKWFGTECIIENDVNSAAVGEAAYGAAKGIHNAVCATIGTGFACGIILDGKLYRGFDFSAGEAGYMISGDDGCTFEAKASTKALVSKAMQIYPDITNGRILADYLADEKIYALVSQWIFEVWKGLRNIICILNPEMLILGGGIMENEAIFNELSKGICQYLPEAFRNTRIEKAKLGNKAGLLGVAYLAEKIWGVA